MAQLIYLGVLSAMDTDESNNTNENPNAVQGTYDETQMQVTSVAMSDNFSSGITYNDDFNLAPDTFTYDVGSGPVTSGLDAEARFAAEVIRAGSTTPENVEISVYQLQDGATFVRLPDGYKISELTIQGMTQDGFDGIYTDSSSSATVVCFASGTWVNTQDGLRKIEDIGVGDLVMTHDHGAQPVRWAARWSVRTQEKTAPVRIKAGTFGKGVPFADLYVSRQHRIYVTSPVAQHMFGSHGALIAAHRLGRLPGVSTVDPGSLVTYVHIMCARHELVTANGLGCETLLNATEARAVTGGLAHPPPPMLASVPVRSLHSAQKQRRFVERLSARSDRQQKHPNVHDPKRSAAAFGQTVAQNQLCLR